MHGASTRVARELCQAPIDLAERLGWPRRSCDALVDGCLGLSLLEESEHGLVISALAEAYLIPHSDNYVGDWIIEEDRTFGDWVYLERCLASGVPISPVDHHGYFVSPPETSQFLHGASTRVARELCQVVSFGNSCVLDMGGGSGAFAIQICLSNPDSKVLLLDRPEVCAVTARRLAESHLEHRITLVPGDFFTDPLPAEVNTVLFANVLHDWSREQIATLLARASDVVTLGGRIIVVEVSQPPERTKDPLSSLLSLSFCLGLKHGFCYAPEIYRNLLESAGFTLTHEGYLPQTGKLLVIANSLDRDAS